MSKRPWWFPEKTDDAYCQRLREDYPHNAGMSDEELIDYYADGQEYSTTWDHIGDAYEQFKPLADAFLEMLEALKDAERIMASHIYLKPDVGPDHPYSVLRRVQSAIAKAEGRS